eukprot:scaffold6776_cov37-Cyclotella_meneghiniana.AAC.9
MCRIQELHHPPEPDKWYPDHIICFVVTHLCTLLQDKIKLQWWFMQAPGWCATKFHPFHTRRPPPDPDKSISVAAICFNLVVDAHMTLQHHLSSLAVQQNLFSLCTLSCLSGTSLMMHELIKVKAYTFVVVVLVPSLDTYCIMVCSALYLQRELRYTTTKFMVCSALYLQRELRYTTTKFDHDPFGLRYSRLYEFLFMLLVHTAILQFTSHWCSTQQHLYVPSKQFESADILQQSVSGTSFLKQYQPSTSPPNTIFCCKPLMLRHQL